MELLNAKVNHKIFKLGTIVSFDSNYVVVKFDVRPIGKDCDEVRFTFPAVFEGFLTAENKKLQKEIDEFIRTAKALKIKQLEEKQLTEKQLSQEKIDKIRKATHKKPKTYKRENIVFKCNYCDGGASENQIGFAGVCSEKTIKYNIEVKNRAWCSHENCRCRQYYDGDLSYADLCKDDFLCYESRMLIDWKASAGTDNNGENSGRRRRLNNVQQNSLCALTTVDFEKTEETRFVFGVFLVDDMYEGDDYEEGYVTTESKYKLMLTPKEARKILFWNYHKNAKDEKRAVWASGLYRYVNDTVSAQMLRDIAKLKVGTADEKLAKEFLEYYCKVNKIDLDNLPEPDGALKK